jgi:hypothetical protein
VTTPPAPAELRELLLAGATNNGGLNDQAAMHLLLFTELPGTARFARHVDVDTTWAPGGSVRVARIRDWDQLIADPDLRLSGTEERFLAIAASFAAGRPADLSAVVTNSLGWAHARRVAEAVLIATGTTALLAIGDTAKLGDLKALHETLSNGQ